MLSIDSDLSRFYKLYFVCYGRSSCNDFLCVKLVVVKINPTTRNLSLRQTSEPHDLAEAFPLSELSECISNATSRNCGHLEYEV